MGYSVDRPQETARYEVMDLQILRVINDQRAL